MTLNISDFKTIVDTQGLAKGNLFEVEILSVGFDTDIDMRSLNFLCTRVNLPGKQILTNDRQIGIKFEKMVNGYGVDDLSLTFLLTNNYNVKNFFEEWAASSISYNEQELRYKNTYTKDIKVFQLNQESKRIHGCLIKEAFPTTLNPIELGNLNTEVSEYNVQLSYTDWETISI